MLPSGEELSKTDFKPKKSWTQFAVFDYDKDKSNDIFIKLDNSSFDIEKKVLNKKGIKTNLVIITFRNGKTIFNDFSNMTQ